MKREKRIEEIIGAMPSFGKAVYYKNERLPEFYNLQAELVNLTFNDNHAQNGKLRIWDAENHFEKLNAECGHIADEELKAFKEGCKFICNAIKSEFSGNAGEFKAFRSLEMIKCPNQVLKNVELKSGDHKAEIDAIVFIEKAIVMLEVKNPHRDIYIDEQGNYYRVGNSMHLDCNIGEKMNEKEYLLREALKTSGYSDAKIVSLVVFTNSTIHVENRYDYITTCFLSVLPYIIDSFDGETLYNDSDISAMIESVTKAECKEAYPIEYDITEFKQCFANLMVTLEEAAKKRNDTVKLEEKTAEATESQETHSTQKHKVKSSSNISSVLGAVIAIGVGFIASQVINSTRKTWGCKYE